MISVLRVLFETDDRIENETCVEFTFDLIDVDEMLTLTAFGVHSSQFTYKILCDVQMHPKPFTILMEIGYFNAHNIEHTLSVGRLGGAHRASCCFCINMSSV